MFLFSFYSPGYVIYMFTLSFLAIGLIIFETRLTPLKIVLICLMIVVVISYNTMYQDNMFSYHAVDPSAWFVANLMTNLTFITSILFLLSLFNKFMLNQQIDKDKISSRLSLQNDLFSIIAHNFRTPLTNITAQIDVTKLRGEKNVDLENVEPSTNHLVEITNDILAHSRSLKNNI